MAIEKKKEYTMIRRLVVYANDVNYCNAFGKSDMVPWFRSVLFISCSSLKLNLLHFIKIH